MMHPVFVDTIQLLVRPPRIPRLLFKLFAVQFGHDRKMKDKFCALIGFKKAFNIAIRLNGIILPAQQYEVVKIYTFLQYQSHTVYHAFHYTEGALGSVLPFAK